MAGKYENLRLTERRSWFYRTGSNKSYHIFQLLRRNSNGCMYIFLIKTPIFWNINISTYKCPEMPEECMNILRFYSRSNKTENTFRSAFSQWTQQKGRRKKNETYRFFDTDAQHSNANTSKKYFTSVHWAASSYLIYPILWNIPLRSTGRAICCCCCCCCCYWCCCCCCLCSSTYFCYCPP